MKKMISIILTAIMLLLTTIAVADVDISGLSFEELVALKDKINLAIWNSQEWQEVTVPQGLWVVGEDIPEGHWTIEASKGNKATVCIGTKLRSNGKEIKANSDRYFSEDIVSESNRYYTPGDDRCFIDFEFQIGDYVEICFGDVIFKPYNGKPSLGFN